MCAGPLLCDQRRRLTAGKRRIAYIVRHASGLAGRYALALLELARDSDVLDVVADDLGGLGSLIAESADLAA